MLFIERSSNQIELKNDSSMFGLIGVMALAMSAFGIFIINGLLPFEDGFTFANVFGLAFACLWTLITFSMGISAFALNSKRITISSEGIGYRTWFKKRMFEWSEIQDWGISFSGRTDKIRKSDRRSHTFTIIAICIFIPCGVNRHTVNLRLC